jgi:hypothetical protein
MSDPDRARSAAVPAALSRRRARWLNLIVPGAGLILAGRPLAGFGTGLAFAAALNGALAIWLLIPDDFPRTAVWCGLTAALAYIVAQFLLLRVDAAARLAGRRDERRAALTALMAAIREGRFDQEAAALLEPLAESDLHVAVRVAQAAMLNCDDHRALAAWQRVQRLDPHLIYRSETLAALQRLHAQAAADADRH